MKRIPKIAHFHWTGPTMSWLRVVSIASFKRFNPEWEIRLHDTPKDIRKHGLAYTQEADWTWWRMLARHGGFQVATDIVFTKPIPDEWLDCGLNACQGGTDRIYQFAMLGAVPRHPFMVASEKACAELGASAKGMDLQRMGVMLLGETSQIEGILESKGELYDQPTDALCYIKWNEPPRLWSDEAIELPESVIGIHWYGGHKSSKANERNAGLDSEAFICQLARSVFP